MEIKTAEFITSSANYKQCPPPDLPEIAFIGRSNVGKSSLINMLTNRKNLAKISARPGKTLLINHFKINQGWYLVDLPGYGWAKVSKVQREKIDQLSRDYILNRENLRCVLVLIDSRLEPQKIDLEFIKWIGLNQVPFVLIFTKADKLSSNKADQHIAKFKKAMLMEWEFLPQIFKTSAVENTGQQEVINFIQSLA
ncbi:MAG: ribosome biogenesis GTP-binding protein YihA/YsxC [Candidatus Cyclobacteriaceae bacterium M3_2C_046]